MKRNLIQLFVFLFLIGCSITQVTPKSAVEDLLKKYQMKDKNVISQLDDIISNESMYSDSQKEQYKRILERQYSDMTYDIKDDEINGNSAIVTVEIEVYDYASVVIDGVYDNASAYTTSLFDAMGNTKERIKYTLEFGVRKTNGKWVVDNIGDVDMKKIHGLY